jgi:hypothetical protein
MSTPESPRRTLIQDLLSEFPDEPKNTLAKLLHERYPHEFPTIERARGAIRYYTGSAGGTSRTKGTRHLSVSPGEQADTKKLDIKIRKGDRGANKPLILSERGKWFMSSDWHVPYHDEHALEAALKHAVDTKCDHIYINGDGLDFYQSSNWEKDPRKRNLDEERKALWEILDQILPHFPGRKIYKIGNHEHRFTRRMYQLQPELSVLSEFNVDRVMHLKERGFDVVKSSQHSIIKPAKLRRINSLHVFHGHELSKGFIAPVNISRGLFLKTNTRSICGHYHRASSHVETAGVGENVITTYSLGCLCNLTPDYAPVNKWNHGCATISVDTGTYKVSNTLIDRGQCYSI